MNDVVGVYKAGTRAWYVPLGQPFVMVPTIVADVKPDGRVIARVTATRGQYEKGSIISAPPSFIYPRAVVRRERMGRSWFWRVTQNYRWAR
jgi:hypothetical protein